MRQLIESVSNGNDTGTNGNLAAAQSTKVAAAVRLFMVSGDEDDNCVAPAVFVKQVCPAARLWICPATGHTVNTEEPALFNQMLGEFLALVDSGRWRARDPRSVAA